MASSPVDGRPLLATTIDRLRGVVEDLVVIAPPDRGYDRFGVEVRSEAIPGQGPLGGIEMALTSARHDRCLIVGCDLPLLNPRLLAWMAGMTFDGDALVPLVPARRDCGLAGSDVLPQPLHAVYCRSCLPTLRRLLGDGERRVRTFLAAIRVAYLSEEDLRRIDPGLASFLNLNSPGDWPRAPGIRDE